MSNLIHRRGLAIGPMASVGFSWGDHHVYAASLAGPDGHQLTKKRLKNARCSLGNRIYSAGFRPRSFFSSGGFVDGTDEGRQLSRLSGGPLDQERVTSLGSRPPPR